MCTELVSSRFREGTFIGVEILFARNRSYVVGLFKTSHSCLLEKRRLNGMDGCIPVQCV